MEKMNSELANIMKEAYGPCDQYSKCCKDHKIKWMDEGHMPRGFCGATGEIKDVKLVLVLAEPGTPNDEEKERWKLLSKQDPDKILEEHNNYVTFECDKNSFQCEIREIVKLCFPPPMDFREAKKKVWITEAVLCSVPGKKSTGPMPEEVEKKCRERYLEKQYEKLKKAYWVAVGRKAERRLKILDIKPEQYTFIYHPTYYLNYKRNIDKAKELKDKLKEDFEKFINNKEKGVQIER